jgi:hypothetical protein
VTGRGEPTGPAEDVGAPLAEPESSRRTATTHDRLLLLSPSGRAQGAAFGGSACRSTYDTV